MVVERALIALLLGLVAPAIARTQSLLDRPVEVSAHGISTTAVLEAIARDAGFQLSYNAALFATDPVLDLQLRGDARSALRAVVGNDVRLVESGAHVILVDERRVVQRITITGAVVDAATRLPLARASVYALRDRHAVSTAADGRFSIEAPVQQDNAALLIARAGYHDTVIYVPAHGQANTVALVPRERLPYLEPRCSFERCAVEDLGATRLLVPSVGTDLSTNMSLREVVPFQFSVWPGIGTNGDVGGAFVNHLSVNFLAGYAAGLEGAEFGVGVNILRRDMKGFQFAGMANLVGGHARGMQFAGAINHTMRSFNGLQLAGLANTVWDTLSGAQVAGGVNVVKGGLRGAQISGAGNVATRGCDGTQISGGFNVAVHDVRKAQVAGAFNYGRSVAGVQVAGGMNLSAGRVGGGQVSGAFNLARTVTGGQVSGALNVAVDTVIGGQVGVINFARICTGGQVGIINLGDTITGMSVGLISIAWRGYHRLDVSTDDVMTLSFTLRTGQRVFHNLLGWSPGVTADGRWGFTYGFGSEVGLGKRTLLNMDLTGQQVVEQPNWVDAVNIVGRFAVSFGARLGPAVLSAGPVLNTLFSTWRDPDTGVHLSRLAPSTALLDDVSGDLRASMWAGWRIGLGVRF